jgi:carboxyl-terminal processing protease
MVVLVNEGTAAGSEHLAAALQELNRAVVVGNRTFGQGTVQTILPLSSGQGLKISTVEFRTPKGQGFHLKGLQPDFPVAGTMPGPGDKEPDVQLQAAVTRLKELVASR